MRPAVGSDDAPAQEERRDEAGERAPMVSQAPMRRSDEVRLIGLKCEALRPIHRPAPASATSENRTAPNRDASRLANTTSAPATRMANETEAK
jgi:hypothetical protein